jgi:hypothetical protein
LITLDEWKDTLVALGLLARTPWAVLLFKFQDDLVEYRPRSYYERLFTEKGTGSMNMVDYFREMSHNKLDLSGSKVFGPITLPVDRADYVVSDTPPGSYNREAMAALCFETAAKDGVELSHYDHAVIVFNTPSDLYGLPGLAVCDSGNAFPAAVGHEMGHGYGMIHSRREGSTEDYQDRWDVMSAMLTDPAPHPEYLEVGPGLNAANMRAQGWLSEGRVWMGEDEVHGETIELRPLHRLDLDGYLAAEVGDFLVEFRLKDRWDAGIGRSCVQVHRFDEGHSYVMLSEQGNYDLAAGDSFLDAPAVLAPRIELEVVSINESDMVATIRLSRHPAPVTPELVTEIISGIAPGGGGLIFLGGKVVKIGPHLPLIALIRPLVALLAAAEAGEVGAHPEAARPALTALAREALLQLRELGPPDIPDEGPNLEHFGL